ncbi:hypothetical protein HPB47_015146 [Ixodes persulcatus]|uniref:Uncharacterized protein n=1 Tax=Ixodes persulcatus TaxID=34615 RepID=A0AC60QUE0_IXOPE|nr:hypothetical protein HPB47_015146 [Ixodes persulcatus]
MDHPAWKIVAAIVLLSALVIQREGLITIGCTDEVKGRIRILEEGFDKTRTSVCDPNLLKIGAPMTPTRVTPFGAKGAATERAHWLARVDEASTGRCASVSTTAHPTLVRVRQRAVNPERQRLFSVLSGFMSSVEVEVIYCDFEAAVIVVCRRHFYQAKVQESSSHLCQSVYRKLCKSGMQARYCEDEEFAVQSNDDSCLLNPWSFLRCLKDEQALQELKMAQLDAGQRPPHLAQKYKDVNERLYRALEEHFTGSPPCMYSRVEALDRYPRVRPHKWRPPLFHGPPDLLAGGRVIGQTLLPGKEGWGGGGAEKGRGGGNCLALTDSLEKGGTGAAVRALRRTAGTAATRLLEWNECYNHEVFEQCLDASNHQIKEPEDSGKLSREDVECRMIRNQMGCMPSAATGCPPSTRLALEAMRNYGSTWLDIEDCPRPGGGN